MTTSCRLEIKVKNNLFSYIVLLLFLLEGCTQTPESAKEKWLNGIPCTPPCWENITPGSTTFEQSIELLENNTDVDNVEISEYLSMFGDPVQDVTWEITNTDPLWTGRIIYVNVPNYTETIPALILYTPDICLKEIVNRYGEPDYIALDNYRYLNTADLIWSNKNFAFSSELGDDKVISKNTCGGFIVHYDSEFPYNEVPVITVEPDTEVVPWEGYGTY